MLHIRLIAVGRLKQKFWTEACNEYLLRLSRYAKVQVVEVLDCNPASAGGIQAAREQETLAVAQRLGGTESYNVLLDRAGEELSSEEIAKLISKITVDGKSSMNIIIGGSVGIEVRLLNNIDKTVSFGKITLPHNLARLVCLEQLYRACKINAGEPYHK